jgi:hypothetical protein
MMQRLQAARNSTYGIDTINAACAAFANGIGTRCSFSGSNVVAENFKRYWRKTVFASSDTVVPVGNDAMHFLKTSDLPQDVQFGHSCQLPVEIRATANNMPFVCLIIK